MEDPLPSPFRHTDFHEGQQIGQYLIVRKIGAGGMGQVFEVRHSVLETSHALKIISTDLADRPKALEYFEREARIMAGLQHPGIVQVDEFGLDDGHHWLRMELVPGLDSPDGVLHTLQDYRKFHGGIVPEHKVAGCLRQFLDAIGYAHQAGVIHRDLKPANILLSPEGMKIGDFGIAKILPKDWEKTFQATDIGKQGEAATKALMGTLAYMSPEQKRGEATRQSDLWSIALIAYQLLTGKDSPSPQPASQTQPGISPEWDGWFRKGLDADPGKRFKDAGEMLAELPRPEKASAPPPRKPQAIPVPALVIAASVVTAAIALQLAPTDVANTPTGWPSPSLQPLKSTQPKPAPAWPQFPSKETLDTPAPPPAGLKPKVRWIRGISSSGSDAIQAAAPGKGGHFHTFGTYSGNLGFHSFTKTIQPGNGATFPCEGNAEACHLLPLEDGTCLLAATFTEFIYIAGNTYTAHGRKDILLAKTNLDGQPDWVTPIGSTGNDQPVGLHEFPGGSLLIAGNFEGELQLAGKQVTTAGGKDFFLLLLSKDGQVLSIRTMGGNGDDTLTHLASHHNTLQIAGTFTGRLPLGNKPMVAKGLQDVFTATIDGKGNLQNISAWGSELQDVPTGFALSPTGTSYLSGSHARSLNLGGTPLPAPGGKGHFLASLGEEPFSRDTGHLEIHALETVPGGSLFALSSLAGNASLDGQTWESKGGSDILLLQFSSKGQLLSSNHFGGTGDDRGLSLAYYEENGSHYLLLSGTCGKDADFERQGLRDGNASNAFVCLLRLQ